MGFFLYFVWALFPSAALLLALLMLPMWGAVRRGVLRFVDSVLFFQIQVVTWTVSLYWALTVIAALTLVAATYEMRSAEHAFERNKTGGVKAMDSYEIVKKFRSERNWWIALFGLSLWLILFRVRQYLHHINKLEVQLEAAKLNSMGTTTTVTSTKTHVSAPSTSNNTGSSKTKEVATAVHATPSAPRADSGDVDMSPPSSSSSKKKGVPAEPKKDR